MLRAMATDESRPSAQEILDRLEIWGQKLGLEATQAVLERLGQPQLLSPTVLVAGTNGKGSTSAALASILGASGLRCGLGTSPHLEDVEERIRVDGRAISTWDLGRRLRQVLRAAGDTPPTYFESLTAAAWLHFAEHPVDAAVVEVGLGGRLDATNVSDPCLSVITGVARDHERQLGFTLTSIAGEKAGVMRRGRTCLFRPGRPEVTSELRRCAATCGARLVDAAAGVSTEASDPGADGADVSLRTPTAAYRFRLPLGGRHQLANVAMAVRAAEEFTAIAGHPLAPDAVRAGIEALAWPGRLEWVDVRFRGRRRRVLFDAAHNPAGAAVLRACLHRLRLRHDLLYGALAEKRPELCLPGLAERAGRVVLTAPDHHRAAAPELLAPLVPGNRAEVQADPAAALESCLAEPSHPDTALVVTGSIYLLGEVRTALRALCGAPPAARDVVTGFSDHRRPAASVGTR